ncbi:MAG: hypothetical protein HYR84_16660 [Planctomycetes bacterium]|nr:hypothetical protein [Planctomycetota bacterium]
MPPEAVDKTQSSVIGTILEYVESCLFPVIGIYFFAGFLLSMAVTRHAIQGEGQYDAAVREAGDALAWFYGVVFELANRPARLILPKEGLYQLFEMDNRAFFLDMAPVAAGFIVMVLLVLALNVVRIIFGIRAPAHEENAATDEPKAAAPPASGRKAKGK